MKFIPVSELAKEWMKDPAFRREYDALEGEFAMVAALIEARSRSGLTQAQIAKRMKTTQTAVARLESGRSNPSRRTLEKFADATGHRLVIAFEPVKAVRAKSKRRGAAPRRAG